MKRRCCIPWRTELASVRLTKALMLRWSTSDSQESYWDCRGSDGSVADREREWRGFGELKKKLQKNSVSILGKVEVAVRKRRAGESETRVETSADRAGIRSVRGTRRAQSRREKEEWRQTGNTRVQEQEEGDQSSPSKKTLMDRNESGCRV